MFGALDDFLHKKLKARSSRRVQKTYPVLYSPDGGASWLPAYGLDMSMGGMKIFSRTLIGDGEVLMRLELGTLVADVRVKAAWHTEGRYKNEIAYEYGMQLVSANAADREHIERWLAGKPLEERNVGAEELREIRLKPDDVDRLLPLDFQHRLFRELLQRGRLAPVDRQHPALVAYDYGGLVRYRGVSMHRLTIHSKVMGPEGEERFRTRVLFDDSGAHVIFPDEAAAAARAS